MIKVGKGKKTTIMFCTSIIVLFILCIIIAIINFFTKNTITKETIVGINPVSLVGIAMRNTEPLTVTIEKEKKAIMEEGIQVEKTLSNVEENKKETENREEIEQIKETSQVEINVNRQEVIENNLLEEKKESLVPTEYQGFATVGKIEIPKTGVNLPILNQVTVEGMKNAPCLLYATGDLNQKGNNLIAGHNFRNNTLFSNNKELNLGDKIYITTLDGNQVEYTIYSKFITTPEDVSYIKRDTQNKPEITLSCCTDDDVDRIVILAKI